MESIQRDIPALKPGGRISICDIVIMKELTQEMKEDEAMHSC